MVYQNRNKYNDMILQVISSYFEKYPEIRFGQMLINLKLNDIDWNEESSKTYNKLIDLICNHYKLKC